MSETIKCCECKFWYYIGSINGICPIGSWHATSMNQTCKDSERPAKKKYVEEDDDHRKTTKKTMQR